MYHTTMYIDNPLMRTKKELQLRWRLCLASYLIEIGASIGGIIYSNYGSLTEVSSAFIYGASSVLFFHWFINLMPRERKLRELGRDIYKVSLVIQQMTNRVWPSKTSK